MHSTSKTMMSRSRASLQYIISGNRILSGEEHGSSGAAGGAEFLKSSGVVGWNVSYLAMWPGESVLSQGECLLCMMWCLASPLFIHCINTQRGCHTLKLEFTIRRFEVKEDGLKLNGTHQFVVYANDVNILGGSVHTIKKNAEALIWLGRWWD